MENIKIIRSRRKTVSLQIRQDASLEVRVPLYMTEKEIMDFLHDKSSWIEKNRQKVLERQEKIKKLKPLTAEEIKELAKKAALVITEKAAYFAEKIGVDYGRITIRCQKSRWGSCSGKGNLNFNCLLMLVPEDVLDYVIVHELCHRKEMNHSAVFWKEVAGILPDYKKQVIWLKENGGDIIAGMIMDRKP